MMLKSDKFFIKYDSFIYAISDSYTKIRNIIISSNNVHNSYDLQIYIIVILSLLFLINLTSSHRFYTYS